MTEALPFEIDWNDQIAAITTLSGGGGIAHAHTVKKSPINLFVNTLIGQLAKPHGGEFRVVQFNPLDFRTVSIEDTIELIADSLDIDLSQWTPPSGLQVASNLEAGRDLSINNVDVHVYGDSFQRAMQRSSLVKFVSAQLLERSRRGERFAVFFVDTHDFDHSQLHNLSTVVWPQIFLPLARHGLLAVNFYDPELVGSVSSIAMPAARAAVLIDLPVRFPADVVSGAARDLATILLARQIYVDEAAASAFALGAIQFSDSIADLHSQLSVLLLKNGDA